MADPYVYEGTNILINKLNIENEQELIDIETQFFIAKMLDIPSKFVESEGRIVIS